MSQWLTAAITGARQTCRFGHFSKKCVHWQNVTGQISRIFYLWWCFIIYTFLLLWPSYQTRHSFLRLINQDLSSSRLCWYTKGTWHISFSPVKHNIQKTSILAQKLVLLLRGKNIHYNSVKLEALLRLETGNWFLFCLFWFLLFYFIQ